MIRAWTEALAPLREALREAGIIAQFTRVDIEPALDAALGRGGFHVIVFDPATPGLSRGVVDARLREHACTAPLVILSRLEDLAELLTRTLSARLN